MAQRNAQLPCAADKTVLEDGRTVWVYVDKSMRVSFASLVVSQWPCWQPTSAQCFVELDHGALFDSCMFRPPAQIPRHWGNRGYSSSKYKSLLRDNNQQASKKNECGRATTVYNCLNASLLVEPGIRIAEIQLERDAVKRILGLNPTITQFRIVYGAKRERDDVVAIQTRSGMQILREMSSFVQVPEEHQQEQRVFPAAMVPVDGQEGPPPLIQILSGMSKPADAFAMIHYNGLWFWIDNRDLRSKITLTFLLILMTLADIGEKAPSPLLTIPVN